jgi:phosphatidylinositol glycan class V
MTGNSKVKQRKSVATETASAPFHDTLYTNQNIKENQDEGSILLVPFVLHLAFMTFTAFFVMHVQVSTCFSALIKACMEALLIPLLTYQLLFL